VQSAVHSLHVQTQVQPSRRSRKPARNDEERFGFRAATGAHGLGFRGASSVLGVAGAVFHGHSGV